MTCTYGFSHFRHLQNCCNRGEIQFLNTWIMFPSLLHRFGSAFFCSKEGGANTFGNIVYIGNEYMIIWKSIIIFSSVFPHICVLVRAVCGLCWDGSPPAGQHSLCRDRQQHSGGGQRQAGSRTSVPLGNRRRYDPDNNLHLQDQMKISILCHDNYQTVCVCVLDSGEPGALWLREAEEHVGPITHAGSEGCDPGNTLRELPSAVHPEHDPHGGEGAQPQVRTRSHAPSRFVTLQSRFTLMSGSMSQPRHSQIYLRIVEHR